MEKHYYLYIDDSGNRFPDKQQFVRDDGMDYFALGGILVEENDKKILEERYKELCERWGIIYPLHSTDIRGMRNNFSWLEEGSKKRKNFEEDLESFLFGIPVIGFAAVIHRPGYNKRYEEKYGDKRWWMCKTTYTVLIERVAKYVQGQGGTFEVRFEECGKKEDRAILQYAKDLKTIGSPFCPNNSSKYSALVCDDYKKVVVGEPRRRMKDNLFVQIADLYLYPMVKRKYNPTFSPWVALFKNKKVIDALLPEGEWLYCGIKYSCFDDFDSKTPE
jgi:hypothetical protein